jgi:hypothetical protein
MAVVFSRCGCCIFLLHFSGFILVLTLKCQVEAVIARRVPHIRQLTGETCIRTVLPGVDGDKKSLYLPTRPRGPRAMPTRMQFLASREAQE